MSTATPADILDVAAVVLGEERLPLRGWQKHHAITAMSALGYSKTHMAWALCTTVGSIEAYCRLHSIPMYRYDQRPDWEAIRWVTHHGARMRLDNPDRVHAIRGLAARGHHCEEIARRLMCSTRCVSEVAAKNHITIPTAPHPAGGWYTGGREPSQQRLVAA